MNQRITDVAVEEALYRLRSGEIDRLDRRLANDRELSLIEAYENNLVDGIARGKHMDPLLAKLKAEERRKNEPMAELDQLTKPASVIELDEARIKRELRSRISDAKTLLGHQRTQARQILRKLLDEPLICEAFEQNGRRGYKVTGKGSYLKLLPGQLATPCVASPTGRDQNPQLEPVCREMYGESVGRIPSRFQDHRASFPAHHGRSRAGMGFDLSVPLPALEKRCGNIGGAV